MPQDLTRPAPMSRLLTIMAQLRDPVRGCPWDQKQNFASIAPYAIEEAYEVADAIAKGDMTSLRDELGDLLLQVVFHAQMAAEIGEFDFEDVAGAISDKMIRRHPHVFGADDITDAAAQTLAWEAQKATERAQLAAEEGRRPSALDGVANALPALTRALKLQNRAARVGFDWPESAPVIAKIAEETAELQTEMTAGDSAAMAEEMGDLLFSVVNLARHLKLDPEAALRAGNDKFERRFRKLEELLDEQGLKPDELGIEDLENAWSEVKLRENTDT